MRRVENGQFLAKNGKPIALLFGQNMVFFGALFNLSQKMKRVENGQFLAKMASL